ncbi:MAG: ATP-dependent chaperone ClpB, partial [Mesorhizobium sp.]
STTYKEFRQFFEKDRALVRRFQKIDVNEPTIEDAIEIMKGLKPYFEEFHKVRYTSEAIKASVELSARYINDRKLPDKAIDLVDEAASRLRMQVDSKPEALDEIDRRIMQLKIEREALKVETDEASKDRLARLEKELVGLEEESTEITSKWQAEKQKLGLAADLKKQLDEARNDLAIAQRKGEFQRAGELAYGKIPELEKKLKEAEAQDGKAGMVEE